MTSKRRREWQESLKQDTEEKTTPKKKDKITILQDETYRNVKGKMILLPDETHKIDKNNYFQDYNLPTAPPGPSASLKFSVKNLTPTFRKPDHFIKAVTKSLTPVKLFPVSYNNDNFKVIECAETDPPKDEEPLLHDDSCSFNFEIEVERNSSLEANENKSKTLELVDVKNNSNSGSKKQTTNGTEICQNHNYIREETRNIAEEYNVTETVVSNTKSSSFDKANSETKNMLQECLKITVYPEIHSQPKNKKKDQGDSNKYENIILENPISNEDQIDIMPEDTTTTTVKPSSENLIAETENITEVYNEIETVTKTKNSKVKRSRNSKQHDKSYLDYMSEEDLDQLLLDEAFPSDASSEEDYIESSDSSNDKETYKKTKKKKKQSKKKTRNVKLKKINKNIDDHNVSAEKKPTKTAVRQEIKKKKEMGESYTNEKGEFVEGKSIKPNPCIGKSCGNDCGSIPEERRQNLFSYFWNLKSHQRRKDWIAQCAVRKSIKRPSKDNNIRSCSYNYFVNEGEGRRNVCQQYLINTLDVSQRFILYTLETSDGYAKTDERGKNGGYNKTKEEVMEHAKVFIESLPKVPSHYCRKDSNRLYLPEEFRNVTNLHRIYKNVCKQSAIKGMSFQVFRTWFKNSYNIGFHVPKKDKCVICCSKNNEEKTEEEKEKIEEHINEKNESYKRFICHQNLHLKDKTTICTSFDMQKVLNTPHGESMMLYYSRKFAVYNFTLYESTTKQGYCNIWTETDAHRGANEICTCLYNYIKELDLCGSVKTLLLYCDSCYGQNKNKSVLSMIRFALNQCNTIKTIQINYLIPGHTYMPVDSIHATIETKIKKPIIWAPSQWPTIMEFARQNPEPYKVKVLSGKDFIGFVDVVNATFKKSLQVAISKLKIATFKKQEPNVMYIKNSMLPNTETIKIPLLPLKNTVGLKENLYPTQLGISAKKYKDLINLVNKNVIPSRFAPEYKNLKMNNKVKDSLIDTDEEDNIVSDANDDGELIVD